MMELVFGLQIGKNFGTVAAAEEITHVNAARVGQPPSQPGLQTRYGDEYPAV